MFWQLEGATFGLLVLTFCSTLVFLYFWGQAENDYNDFDWCVRLHSLSKVSYAHLLQWLNVFLNKPIVYVFHNHTLDHITVQYIHSLYVAFFSIWLNWSFDTTYRFVFEHLGSWFPWSVVLLVIAATCFTYVTVLVVCVNPLCSLLRIHGFQVYLKACSFVEAQLKQLRFSRLNLCCIIILTGSSSTVLSNPNLNVVCSCISLTKKARLWKVTDKSLLCVCSCWLCVCC